MLVFDQGLLRRATWDAIHAALVSALLRLAGDRAGRRPAQALGDQTG